MSLRLYNNIIAIDCNFPFCINECRKGEREFIWKGTDWLASGKKM